MRRVRCQPAWVSRQIASGHGLLSTGRSPSVTDLAEVELAKFVAAPGQPRASDPLTWWHDNMARFPLLSAAARRHLAKKCFKMYMLTQWSHWSGWPTSGLPFTQHAS